MNGSEPIHAASDTDAPRQSHSKLECIQRRGPRSKVRGKKGSGAAQRCKSRKSGAANKTIAPATANESWKPVENSSFVSRQSRKKAAAARVLARKAFRSENKPRSKIEGSAGALMLDTCRPGACAQREARDK